MKGVKQQISKTYVSPQLTENECMTITFYVIKLHCRKHFIQLSVAEMRMLRWICGHTRRDRVRNDDIRDRLGVAPIEEKLVQHRLRWFGHVQRRPPEAPVRSGILSQDSNVKRGRGRPKLTWVEAIKET